MKMRKLFKQTIFLAFMLITLLKKCQSTVMNFKLTKNRPVCIYADLFAVGEKYVFFYSNATNEDRIHAVVRDAKQNILYNMDDTNSADMVFATINPGTHQFCFASKSNNDGGIYVSTEIITENDTRLPVSSVTQSESAEGRSLKVLSAHLTKLGHTLVNAEHLQRSIRAIEHREETLILKSSKNISIISFLQALVLCALSIFQILCVNTLFSRSR